MLITEKRPRNLTSWHAGPLLFGDWGTSRLYVLGLAFYYTAHASVFYLAAMSVIMAAVAWGYTIVCRCFPDGGGVYSAARRISPLLSVIAATLLLCDFIVTAALSAVEGFHYLGVESQGAVVGAAIGTMGAMGVLNWLGAKSAGRFALVIAIAAILGSSVIGVLCVPLLPEGLRHARPVVEGVSSPWHMWESLVRIVLALSGVEAVASMTGLMRQPVERTAKRTIWPVLIEVVVLNLVFGIALNALPGRVETRVPDYVAYEQRLELSSDLTLPEGANEAQQLRFAEEKGRVEEVREYRQTAVKLLAEHAGTRMLGEKAGKLLATASGVIFGLLLLSAVNTAIMAMVSVLYALAHDRELPRGLTKLNYSGVPWIGLVLSCVMPAAILLFVHDDKALGELYAIGVVGAIAINMLSCAASRDLPIGKWERRGMWALGGLMTGVELTIIVAKPHAAVFAGSVIAAVLMMRYFVRKAAAAKPLPEPEAGWLAEIRTSPAMPTAPGPRIMLAARGRDNAEYAVDMARRRKGVLFVIYVRTLRVLDVQPGSMPRLEDDPQGQESLGTAAVIAKQAGVPFVPIYVTSTDIAGEILDFTVTFGCATLIMGKSRRARVSRALEGDVLAQVTRALPEGVELITRSAGAGGGSHLPAAEVERPVKDEEEDDREAPPS